MVTPLHLALFMKHDKKVKIILFGQVKTAEGNFTKMTLNCWVAGNFIKFARFEKIQTNDRNITSWCPQLIMLLYVYEYCVIDNELLIQNYSVERLIDGDGNFIT